jgi:hypothetical protein
MPLTKRNCRSKNVKKTIQGRLNGKRKVNPEDQVQQVKNIALCNQQSLVHIMIKQVF